MSSARPLLIEVLAVLALIGCGGATRAPAPLPAAPAASPMPPMAAMSDSAAPVRNGYSAADVRFMQHMIGHHGQALTMAALVPSRTQNDAMRLLAERITISQHDEIAMMRRWLEARHEAVPMEAMDMHSMHSMPMGGAAQTHDAAGDHAMMPGMLTDAQLAALAATTGTAFDRLFLQDMIQHHEGALTMVASLFGSTGAAQEPELFRLASDVDADQRAEIARMRALLAALPASQ